VYATQGTSTNARLVDGTGWIPVDFTKIGSGAPLGNLPVDSLNTITNFYGYAATTTNNGFKLTAVLESSKYNILMTTDGGFAPGAYESGTNLAL
jgi:hypothetical protein